MKTKNTFALGIAAGITMCTSAHAVVLFADTFNRPDNTNLNASPAGKSGTQAAADWQKTINTGNPVGAAILNNGLRIGESTGNGGGGWAVSYLDHNFTDSSILASGSFTVSLDLVGPVNSGGATRFTGFMVGNSLAEMSGWAANNPVSTFTSDFFFGYDTTGTNEVKISINGANQDFQQSVNLDAGATLSATFSATDFNSGSTVNYEAFINGGSVKTGTFQWSGTNENYLGIYSNYGLGGAQVDNFSVTDPSVLVVIPEPSSAALLGLGGLALILRRRK